MSATIRYATVTVELDRKGHEGRASAHVRLPEDASPRDIEDATVEAETRATLAAGVKLGLRGYSDVHVDSGVPCRIQLTRWDARVNAHHCSDVLVRDVTVARVRGASPAAVRRAAEIDASIAAEMDAEFEREMNEQISRGMPPQ